MSEFYTVYVILLVVILDQDKFKHQGQGSYFRSNPLCANIAYVFLNNYSIDFNLKSRSVYFV